MSSSQKQEGYSLISKNDLKCIWMTAGLLTYKLCKYNLQCEKCPLDWELRNLSSTPSFDSSSSSGGSQSDLQEALPTPLPHQANEKEPEWEEDRSPFTIRYSLFYHPGHTWVKVEGSEEVRIGIDQFLAATMGKVKAVLLFRSRKRCTQGETLGSIIQEEGMIHIVSPLSGYILSFNPNLKDHPDRVRQDPLGEGYLLTLKPKNLQREQKNLIFGEAAAIWCRKEWERLKEELISERPRGQERLGLTMQDGGLRLRVAKDVIGPERYLQLINAFLRKGERLASPLRSRRERRKRSLPD